MRFNMGTGGHEDVHWGQCFEEFYGAEYCKNLKKDLEKLKDEFYDGNAQRFQREWVLPTANLLRRLQRMGFPVRTRDYIVIHLYNPVDSMFAGEMHFQVGRKGPGTLTLKFTKQTTEGMFIIQPKTLSNADEKKLSENPLEFFEKVRGEMTGLVVDPENLLQVMVLMTETCKLQRQCAKLFFSNSKLDVAPVVTPTSHVPETTTSTFPSPSLPYPSNQWAAATLLNPELGSLRPPEGNFPFPLNFCVKNYVNCNPKPGFEVGGGSKVLIPHHQSEVSNGHHNGAGVTTYRKTRSSTWHAEPEENDETLELQSYNESNWPRQPPDSIEEIHRRMSDARLWDATKEPTVSSSQRSHVASRGGPSSVQSYDVSQATNIETKVWRDSEARTSLTDEYTGDSNAVASGASGSGVQITRKTSEQRTAATEEYVGDSNSKVEPNVGMNVLGCKIGQNLNAEGLLLHREGAGERTSLTEEYAGDVSPNTSNSTTALCVRRKDNVFKDGFIESSPLPKSQGQSPDGRISTRTALVNDYAGAKLNGSSSNPLLFTRPGGGISAIPSALEGSTPFPELHDGRRTSSLDGYIGNPSVVSNDSSDSARVHSDSSLDDNKRFQRTSLVDQYFQEVSRSLDAERFGTPYQPSPFSRVSFQGPMDSHSRGDADEMSWSSEREMTRSSLDSWMSHTGPVPLQSHMLLEAEDQADVSLLSHTSFPSWASHPCIPASTNPGGRVLIPVAVEEINKNAKTWK